MKKITFKGIQEDITDYLSEVFEITDLTEREIEQVRNFVCDILTMMDDREIMVDIDPKEIVLKDLDTEIKKLKAMKELIKQF